MIVYRPGQFRIEPARQLASIRNRLEAVRVGQPLTIDQATSLLIDQGEIECGWSDLLFPERDELDPAPFANLTLELGRLFCDTWLRRGLAEQSAGIARSLTAADRLSMLEMPGACEVSIAEGFAWYGLYPEQYLEAAEQAAMTMGASAFTVIGIRSIGVPLSGVVAARLLELGYPVQRITVRPRGHPFDRHLSLGRRLESWLAQQSGCFLIVDEGPGISGSSFTCVAGRLSELGIGDDRIAFLPGWDPDPVSLCSAAARQRWPRHRRFAVQVDTVLRGSEPPWSDGWEDLSGGRWRQRFYQEQEFPAVNPAFERRKFLRSDLGSCSLSKFAGLGHYGAVPHSLAELMGQAGYGSAPRSLTRGFLHLEFHPGRPMSPSDRSPAFVRHVARYVAFRVRCLPASRAVPCHDLAAMARHNLVEATGVLEWSELSSPHRWEESPAMLIDGRMQSHEWVARAAGGWMKADAVDHHADHFYPGPADPAWDLAGFSVEFGLEPELETLLLQEYARCSGDTWIPARIPFYRTCYLAARLGYCSHSADSMAGTPEGDRMRAAGQSYLDAIIAPRADAIAVSPA